MKYTARIQTKVVTNNTEIEADGFSTLRLHNIGDEAIRLNDNIIINAGEKWSFENDPNVIINQNFYISFSSSGSDPKILIEQIYFNNK